MSGYATMDTTGRTMDTTRQCSVVNMWQLVCVCTCTSLHMNKKITLCCPCLVSLVYCVAWYSVSHTVSGELSKLVVVSKTAFFPLTVHVHVHVHVHVSVNFTHAHIPHQMDGSSRPQRSTALNTMSAIHISNNPPPLKQSPTRTPPLPHKLPPLRTTSPDTPSPVKDIREHPSPRQPKQITVLTLPDEESDPPLPTKPLVKKAGSPKVSPNNEVTSGDGKAKKATKYVTIPSIEYPVSSDCVCVCLCVFTSDEFD